VAAGGGRGGAGGGPRRWRYGAAASITMRRGELLGRGESWSRFGRALAVKADLLFSTNPAALPTAKSSACSRRCGAASSRHRHIYVTQTARQVARIADRVTCCATVAAWRHDDAATTSPGALVEMIVGRSWPTPSQGRRASAAGSSPSEQAIVARSGRAASASAAGETLGWSGMRGDGHHTVGRAIFGTAARGRPIVLEDRRVDPCRIPPTQCASIGSSPGRRAEESSPPTWRCAGTYI